MAKSPISVTLTDANLVWLKGITERAGARSVSETLDRLISAARDAGTAGARGSRSIAGTIDILPDDAALDTADQAVRDLFARSLARPQLVKEARPSYHASRRRRG